ncbi:Zinc finger and SCAN domain-containing protein 23 [Heterocephalus glaber]|uniref:Zinc finger and SCAN domain-containing protein 23 n=1 Tax=Heterocephalus glaber TaxID=10181 RepID=G5BSH2_HETGA|nr:Zinc finger and SCAN domain-containing protein 23 [Heterocephalus glaber]
MTYFRPLWHVTPGAAVVKDCGGCGSGEAQRAADPSCADEQEEVGREKAAQRASQVSSCGQSQSLEEQLQCNSQEVCLVQEIGGKAGTWDVELAPEEEISEEVKSPGEAPETLNGAATRVPECGDACDQEGRLDGRWVSSAAERPHVCGDCGKSFTQNSILVEHQRRHTGEKPYTCGVCGRAFSQRSGLFQHQRLHTGEKRYQCRVCGKAFSQNAGLFHHLRIHTGEKPYQCSQCSKSFSRRSVLIKHQRIHTGERPYECEECGKNFIYHCNLIQHRKVHPVAEPAGSLEQTLCIMQCQKMQGQKRHLLKYCRESRGTRRISPLQTGRERERKKEKRKKKEKNNFKRVDKEEKNLKSEQKNSGNFENNKEKIKVKGFLQDLCCRPGQVGEVIVQCIERRGPVVPAVFATTNADQTKGYCFV